MWDLEYLLLFGSPENKVEISEGKTRCVFPFVQRADAERHFEQWPQALARWLDAPPPAIAKHGELWSAEVAGAMLELYPRPIELHLPLEVDPYLELDSAFWRRDFWDGQPKGNETGWEDRQRHFDVLLNVWQLFREIAAQQGGRNSGRVDIALSDTDAVAPDQYYFRPDRPVSMIGGDYFSSVPDIVVEVLSPATRRVDPGIRKDVYRRAGVRYLWLLDPEVETFAEYELVDGHYRLAARHGSNDRVEPVAFPGRRVEIGALFDSQSKRHPEWFRSDPPEPIPAWLVPAEKRLGLEYLLLLGHPERRREIWNNRAPCTLAFGSVAEAECRFRDFVEDAYRWVSGSPAVPPAVEPGSDSARVGPFSIARRGRIVHMDVAVDARRYRDLLEACAQRDAWDWGDETLSDADGKAV